MSARVEIGSDNVYADLGYADAAEMQRKAVLVSEISRRIKVHRLTQNAAAQLLGIDEGKLAEITRGRFRSVSETELMQMVATLVAESQTSSATPGITSTDNTAG